MIGGYHKAYRIGMWPMMFPFLYLAFYERTPEWASKGGEVIC